MTFLSPYVCQDYMNDVDHTCIDACGRPYHHLQNQKHPRRRRRRRVPTNATLFPKVQYLLWIVLISIPRFTTGTPIGQQRNVVRNDSCWWKAALSGSIAGAVATTILYPLDAAKTLRQAHIASISSTTSAITAGTATSAIAATATTTTSLSSVAPPISSVYDALRQLVRQRTVYVGLSTAILGAIPSSALYFGAYETSKAFLGRTFIDSSKNAAAGVLDTDVTMLQRCLWHSTSAAIGNLISSAVFVPKEVIKQQMQYSGTGTSNVLHTIQHIITERGIKNGLYIGYRATVLRNIPSAALRFTFYEELKRYINRDNNYHNNNNNNNTWKLYIAGAMAGAMASGIMTPMDLIKTKLSTGTCPVNEVQGCIQYVIQQNGVVALWTGAGSRMISSALFSAIGFGTFETCQHYLKSYHRPSTGRQGRIR